MKQTITQSQFINEFKEYGREDNFSYNGLVALYNYLIDLEDDLGVDLELDVIALCCEYSEYVNIEDIIANYDCIGSMSDLYDYTQVIEFDGGIIIQDF